jgi:hypothetical protein
MQEPLPDLLSCSWAVRIVKYYTGRKGIIENVAVQNCLLDYCGNVPWLLTNPTVKNIFLCLPLPCLKYKVYRRYVKRKKERIN